MKRLNWVLVVLMVVSVGLFLGACSSTDRRNTSTTGAKMTDSDLKDTVEGKLKADPDLRAADLSVSADVDNNEVKLSGKVDSEALRTKAIELAKSAHPGLIVTDKIDVEPRELGRSDNGNGMGNDTGTGSRTDDNRRPNDRTQPSSPNSPRR